MFLLSNTAKHLHISCHKFMKGPFVILNWKENFVLLKTIYNVLCFHAGRDCKGSLHQKAKSNCKPLSPSCTYWHHTLVYILVYVFSQMASIIFLSGKTGNIAFVYLFIIFFQFINNAHRICWKTILWNANFEQAVAINVRLNCQNTCDLIIWKA